MKLRANPGDTVNERTLAYFSDADEEFVSLLIMAGMQKNVAKVLVFLAGAGTATSRTIERGADLRQPEVSIALSRMKALVWVADKPLPSKRKGRPNKEFRLSLPLRQILAMIEQAARQNMEQQLGIVHRMRSLS